MVIRRSVDRSASHEASPQAKAATAKTSAIENCLKTRVAMMLDTAKANAPAVSVLRLNTEFMTERLRGLIGPVKGDRMSRATVDLGAAVIVRLGRVGAGRLRADLLADPVL